MGALELSLVRITKSSVTESVDTLRHRLRTLVETRHILDELDAAAYANNPPDQEAADVSDEALFAWWDAANVVRKTLDEVAPNETFDGLADAFRQAHNRGLMSESRQKRHDEAMAEYRAGRFVKHEDIDDEFRPSS